MFDNAVNSYMPPGFKLIKYSALMFYDREPGFINILPADMELSVQQFVQSRNPSSLHHNTTHYTFVVNVAAGPVAASAT